MPGKKTWLFIADREFENQTFYLSGHSYMNCTFKRCVLVIKDCNWGPMPNCVIEDCIWHLDFLIQDRQEWEFFVENQGEIIAQSLPSEQVSAEAKL